MKRIPIKVKLEMNFDLTDLIKTRKLTNEELDQLIDQLQIKRYGGVVWKREVK